jgi:hypothetical protein
VNFCGLLRIPYVRDNRYRVTVFDHDRQRGGIIGVELSFGFMEEPNVERACCAAIAERDRLITMNEKLRQLLMSGDLEVAMFVSLSREARECCLYAEQCADRARRSRTCSQSLDSHWTKWSRRPKIRSRNRKG